LREGHATVNEPSRVAAQEGVREKDQKLHCKRRLSCGGNLVVAGSRWLISRPGSPVPGRDHGRSPAVVVMRRGS
jgi:hypothetical protein